MREIKFRYRLQSYTTGEIITKIVSLEDLEEEDNDIFVEERWGNETNGYKILSRDQFIDRKDKNGIEIYERDVLKGKFAADDVNYIFLSLTKKEKEIGEKLFVIDDIYYQYENYLPDDLEIIGNVYEK